MPAIQTSVELDPAQLERVKAALAEAPRAIPTAIMRALNRGMDAAFKATKDAVTGELNLKKSEISGGSGTRGRIQKKPATRAVLSALVQVSGKRIALKYFGARAIDQTNRKRKASKFGRGMRRAPAGVTYQIDRAGGRKYIEQAFMAFGKAGGEAGGTSTSERVFRRVGASRLPIRELFGPSIPHVAGESPTLKQALDIDVSAVIAKRLESQIELALEKGREPPDA